MPLEIEVLADAGAAARRGAALVAAAARSRVARSGRFALALSGGSTPGLMLRALADEDLPWSAVHLFQVDERVAPAGHPERNLTGLRESLLGRVPLPEAQLHAMPVEAPDLEAAARRYADELAAVGGSPARLDLVHLGLGNDGHTASLLPGDPVLAVRDADVALTAPDPAGPGGWRRMTLTLPALHRARCVLWLVTGADKAAALARLRAGDAAIPAARVRASRAVLLTDRAALTSPTG